MPRRRAWLTPDTPTPGTERCRRITVPDDLAFVGAVTGALLPLTDPDNWEQSGTMSPSEAAGIMSASFEDFVASDCEGTGDCPPPTIPDTDYPFVRRNPTTGNFEEFNGEEWVEPSGDNAIPNPTAREETTADERKCSAAANATAVLKSVYAGMVEFYDTEVDPLLNAGEWALLIAGEISAPLSVSSAAFVAFSQLAWGFFCEALETVTADYWDSGFDTVLTCILRNASTDTAGVVTFNTQEIQNELIGFIAPVVDEYLPVRWQVWYMLQFIGGQGLNLAGTKEVTTGDCVECDSWCHEFDFSIETYSWAAIQSFCGAFYSTGVGANGFTSRYATCPPSNHTELRFRRTMSQNVHITRVEVDYGATAITDLHVLAFANSTTVNGTGTYGVNVNWTGTDLRFDMYKGNANNSCYIRTIRLTGDGTDPFAGYPTCG